MIDRVISGGQTGADQGGLRAARAAGIPTGGWACKGWLVEKPGGHGDVPAPWLADWGLVECPEPGYPARRKRNVTDSDASLLFGDAGSHGSRGLLRDAEKAGKPVLNVRRGVTLPGEAVTFLRYHDVKILNVAGNRESAVPGIGARVERFLAAVFKKLREGGSP
jgi:hypothetical protein